MIKFSETPLKKLIDDIGENETRKILSDFSCYPNPDIELFLKEKSIDFEKQRICATHLVFFDDLFIGYYTFSLKAFDVYEYSVSKSFCRRISRFSSYDPKTQGYLLPAPLLAQFGKNFLNNRNNIITGNELLKMAIDNIKKVQRIIGGKVLFLECEDNSKLIDFYKNEGFQIFARRYINNSEDKFFIQMLAIIN